MGSTPKTWRGNVIEVNAPPHARHARRDPQRDPSVHPHSYHHNDDDDDDNNNNNNNNNQA